MAAVSLRHASASSGSGQVGAHLLGRGKIHLSVYQAVLERAPARIDVLHLGSFLRCAPIGIAGRDAGALALDELISILGHRNTSHEFDSVVD
jgi:hypothetical protein